MPSASIPPATQSSAALKRQLLERLLRERAAGATAAQAERLTSTSIEAPLSSAQTRIWFFEELCPGTSMFNVPFVLRLSGALDLAAFERALASLIDRHSVFRTTIARRDSGPVQLVAPSAPAARIEFTDLSGVPDKEREAEADRVATRTLRGPFDLERGPLFRAAAVRLSPAEHVFFLPMHHLICDGWSVQLIGRELLQIYSGEVGHARPELAPIHVHYADFARRQQQSLAAGQYREDLSYWRERLAGAPPTTELPTDFPRVTGQITAGASENRVVPGFLRDGLRALARQHEVTLFMAMLATFDSLLLRLTGQRDIVIGVPVAGRSPDTEALVGCFINHVAIRADLSGDVTFADVLQRVRHSALGAYAHQDVPFDRVVEELHPVRDPGRPPLFQIQFNMTFAACERLEIPGLVATPGSVEEDWSRYDLAVYFIEFDEGIAWRIVYNSELYARTTVLSLMDRFEHLIAQVVADPARRVADYSVMSAAEEDTLLGAFGGPLE